MNCIAKKILPLLLLLSGIAKAQTITGKIFDNTENKAVANAVVAILKPADSILLKFTRTNNEGNFELKNVPPGKYILMVTHPRYADFVDDITTNNDGLQLNTVKFTPKSQLLQEIFVRNGGAIKIKGDTISYTADSFKVSANANVEELLKKLPGIQVDKDGKIKAMGETVEKVLVDGEEFFGDDPGMAVKNLRADAVKEVQVFDKKSEQSEFTGIDDGSKQKTINLKLKDDKKKGYFGKIDAAAGPLKKIDNRYNTNLMLNAFKGKRKIAVFSINGNTGQDGLNWQDKEKYSDGGNDNFSMDLDEEGQMNWQWRGGNSDEEPDINTQNGFITSNNAGIHYSNKWNDKIKLALSPKYNRQLYNNIQNSFIQRRTAPDTALNTYETKNQVASRYNFMNNLTYDMKFDSSNSMKITLKANFYHTDNAELTSSETRNDANKALINTFDNDLHQKLDKNSVSASVIFRHRFKKARRTLSLNVDFNRLGTNGTNFLKSNNEYFSNGLPDSTVLKDQMFDIDKVTKKLSAKLTYTEPLSKKFSAEIGYEFAHSSGSNDRITYNYSALSGKYDDVVDTLSNNFDQAITVNKPSFKINYNFKKIKFNVGSGFGITNFDFKDISFGKNYKRNYTNAFPSASFSYAYKANHNLYVSYNGNTTQPSLSQLQPLRNNDDNNNQYLGNPDLKQSFTHSFNINHNSYNFLKELWTYQSFYVNSTMNSIKNNYIIDNRTGKTIIKPINTNGDLVMGFWGGMGKKIKKWDMNINFGPGFTYTKFADVINGAVTFSKTLNTGMRIGLDKTKDKKYDFSISDEFNYNTNKTSFNSSAINNYFTNTVYVNATVYYKKVWSISSEYNFFARQKTEQFSSNLTNHILNGRLQRTFKNNEFTAYVLVRDILNQNIGVERSYYGITTSEITNQRLKRYFMIGFAWDFKNNGPKPAAQTP